MLREDNLYALIFAGGGGTRLWPLSREKKPKQFLKLFSDKTLLQETFERVAHTVSREKIYVITMQEYKDEVIRQLHIAPGQVIIEQERKNTGPAAFLGLTKIKEINPQAIVVNVWADHKIDDYEAYKKAILKGAEVASSGEFLVATGIAPTFPHTGLGYIKKGEAVGHSDAFRVLRFVEKPDIKLAEDMLDEGGYLWNVGLYIWRIDAALLAFEKYAKNIVHAAADYSKMPEISIDKAISEKARNLVVIEGKFDWSDVGDFEVLWEKTRKDSDGNAIFANRKRGGWVGLKTQGGFFASETGQLIVTYGLENFVVVATRDSVLVLPKGDAQKVKDLVVKLRQLGKKEVL